MIFISIFRVYLLFSSKIIRFLKVIPFEKFIPFVLMRLFCLIFVIFPKYFLSNHLVFIYVY